MGVPGKVSTGFRGLGKEKKHSLKALPMSPGLEDPLIWGIQGDRCPLRHLAKSQKEVEGSVMRRSSHSCFTCRKVVQRTALRWRRVGP